LKKIIAIIGARPQFIKHFPLELASKGKINLLTIHTGQHYNAEMSQIFFDELGMSKPDYMLEVGSGSHGMQTGKMMIDIESVLIKEKPDGVIVYGDTNSTLAGSLVASKLHIPIFHIEAGIRSYNREMPEEVNRVLTDHVSSLMFVPSNIGVDNLKKEGIVKNVIEVGDIMKDLIAIAVNNNWLTKENDEKEPYYYSTIHRPYNTDTKERLLDVLHMLNSLDKKVIFPIHPRTKNLMLGFQLYASDFSNVEFIKPQGYLDNLSYLSYSSGLVTDSGGMQKEAYWMRKRCVTIRKETEWIETVEKNWNTLVFNNLENVKVCLSEIPDKYISLYGDGNAGNRIINEICSFFN
jgi:UDP-GlcNAc3NAcA epimerase